MVSDNELQKGDEIAGAKLMESVLAGERVHLWKARRNDGTGATVHALVRAGRHQREIDNFLGGARKLVALTRRSPLPGVVDIKAIVPTEVAYLARGPIQGTMEDLAVLGYGMRDTVRFVRKICLALRELHVLGVMHGCLRPANVLLDDDLEPRLSDVGMIVLDDSYDGPSDMRHDYAPYAAREVRLGQRADPRSDIFSVGRLLYYAVLNTQPPIIDDEIALLDELDDHPRGLTKIIRRCTTKDPAKRYASIDELLGDLERWETEEQVGIDHPHGFQYDPTSGEFEAPPISRRGQRDSFHPRDSRPPAMEASRSSRPPPEEVVSPAPSSSGRPPAAGEKDLLTTTYRAPDLETEDIMTPQQARLGGTLGALLVAGSLVFAYVTALPSAITTAGVVLGAVGLSLALPVMGSGALLSRLIGALVLAGGVWFVDPVPLVAEVGRRAKLNRGSPEQRAARVQALARRGFHDFRNMDFSGVDFGGLELKAVRFDSCTLRGVSFVGAVLAGSIFSDADVAGADFSGADLSGANLISARGWVDARCDGKTVMPEGWVCSDSKPEAEQGAFR